MSSPKNCLFCQPLKNSEPDHDWGLVLTEAELENLLMTWKLANDSRKENFILKSKLEAVQQELKALKNFNESLLIHQMALKLLLDEKTQKYKNCESLPSRHRTRRNSIFLQGRIEDMADEEIVQEFEKVALEQENDTVAEEESDADPFAEWDIIEDEHTTKLRNEVSELCKQANVLKKEKILLHLQLFNCHDKMNEMEEHIRSLKINQSAEIINSENTKVLEEENLKLKKELEESKAREEKLKEENEELKEKLAVYEKEIEELVI
ncbi:uncharacterized protein LOC134829003 [Culicoides brevitarsis]|uniref:uncharacterized protein LOC134829003 n=1 Tax=Culicoides brevitarsis TaxID=469753 RepID=UPI00307C0CCC